LLAKLPDVPKKRTDPSPLAARDWRQLWHVVFGQPDELPPRHCISPLLTADNKPIDKKKQKKTDDDNDDDNITDVHCPGEDAVADAMRVGARPGAANGEQRRTLIITGGLGNIGIVLLLTMT
jgi:hypothetical protein